jgi:RNA polymerase sigma-70 factor (ECF subfamily)
LSLLLNLQIDRTNLDNVSVDIHRELIEQSKNGIRVAQYELYKLYSKAMYNICYRLLNNRNVAEDILQDTFIDAFTKLDLFRYESTFGAWLKQIAVNKCLNELNKTKTNFEFIDIENYDFAEENGAINEEELKMSVAKVKEATEQLPEGCRVVFSLYSFEGYDHQEIARILKISESTSKTQYMRAKQLIKEMLIKNNYATR